MPLLSLRQHHRALREAPQRLVSDCEAALQAQRHDAYREVQPEHLRRQAKAVTAALEAGFDPGPLAGAFVSVKDLYGVPGYRTAAGSPKNLPATFEAAGPLVARTQRQLGLVTGKTHTVEFAFGGIGTNPHCPTPINPWDAQSHRAPGGSSAGAGVSIVEGSAQLAFGTDTAGSVRIPAAWTGCVGLKTTKGRWSTQGIVPLSFSLDTAGILARDIGDLRFAFEALDPHHHRVPDVNLSGLRLGICEAPFFEKTSPGVAEAIEAALRQLETAGVRRQTLDFAEAQEAIALFNVGGPVSTELYTFLQKHLPAWYEGLDPNVRARVGNAGSLPAHEYLRRLDRMNAMATAARQRLEEVDVLVTPTVANTPPRLEDINTGERYAEQNLLCLRNTSVVSYLGLCALTLPCGLDAAGMPVGLQLVAGPNQEERLLAIGAAVEAKLGTAAERLGTPPRLR